MCNAFGAELAQAKAGQVEHVTVAFAIGEEAGVIRIYGNKVIEKLWADFVGGIGKYKGRRLL